MNHFTKPDKKYYEFLFDQEVDFPEELMYDKVLSRAAAYSRTYLNKIFTRQDLNLEDHPEVKKFVIIWEDFKHFKDSFNQVEVIVRNSMEQN